MASASANHQAIKADSERIFSKLTFMKQTGQNAKQGLG
jgi:hypothetical protein